LVIQTGNKEGGQSALWRGEGGQKCNVVWTSRNRKSEILKIKWPFKGNSALSLEATRTEEYTSDRKWEQEQFF